MLIEARGLTKIYGMGKTNVPALSGVSVKISQGEFVAIMGPSGSGKSTLMHILGCLAKPTSGQYLLEGNDVGRLADNKLAEFRNEKIGFVFQTFNLLARTSALANVELPMIYRGLPRKNRRIRARELLESVGMGERIQHHPDELSGGERQKVTIARALANQPSIIFADEPTGNLDSQSGEEIMKIFGRLHKEGNTIIMVTHEKYIADHTERIIHLKDGQIVNSSAK